MTALQARCAIERAHIFEAERFAQVLMCARRHLGEILSAFEFLDRAALEMTLRQLPNIQNPLPESDVSDALSPESIGNAGRPSSAIAASITPASHHRTIMRSSLARDDGKWGHDARAVQVDVGQSDISLGIGF